MVLKKDNVLVLKKGDVLALKKDLVVAWEKKQSVEDGPCLGVISGCKSVCNTCCIDFMNFSAGCNRVCNSSVDPFKGLPIVGVEKRQCLGFEEGRCIGTRGQRYQVTRKI